MRSEKCCEKEIYPRQGEAWARCDGGRVGGIGCGRKEQVLRSWKILTSERWSDTPYPPVQGQGAADLKADASAADPPSNRKAAELHALESPF